MDHGKKVLKYLLLVAGITLLFYMAIGTTKCASQSIEKVENTITEEYEETGDEI